MKNILLKKVKVFKMRIFLLKLSQERVKVEIMREMQRVKTGCVRMRKKVTDFFATIVKVFKMRIFSIETFTGKSES